MKYVNKRIKRRQIFSFKEPSKQAIWLDANDFKKKIYKNGQWVEVGGTTVETQIEYVNQYFEDTIVQQAIQVDTGWNWIGLMVGTEDDMFEGQILNPVNNMIIKNTSYISTYENDHWEGSFERLEAGSAYMVYNPGESFTLIIQGHLVNPLNKNYGKRKQGNYNTDMIVDENGWVTFVKSYEMDLNQVTFNIELNDGIRLYGHNPASIDDSDDELLLATYHNNTWDNNITIQPGHMYMIRLNFNRI